MGRRVLVLGLGVVLCGSLSALEHGQDTITVDGVPLELNLDVRRTGNDATAVDAGKVRPLLWKPVAHVGCVAGAGLWQSDVAGLPVSQVAGRPWSGSLGLEGGLTWEAERSRWRWHLGLGAQGLRTADLTSLQDSTVALVPDGAGGIEQHIVQTYELGVELDTVPLTLDANLVQTVRMGIQVGGQGASRSPWSWWVGGFLCGARLNRSPAQVERLPAEGLPEPLAIEGLERLDWVPLQSWSWGVVAEVDRRIHKHWSWCARVEWMSSPRGRVGCGMALVHHFVR